MIVDCAAYREGQRVDVPADPGPVAAVVAGAGSFGWIGMRMPDADELVGVRQEIGWADFPVDEILARHRRPVLDVDPGRLQLVLRTARYDDHQEKVAIGELSVVVTDDWVITARWGQAAPLADLRQELEQDPERLALGPYAVLVGVVTKVVEGFRPSLDGFEQDVLQTELEVFSPDRHLPINRIYNLKRQVRDLLMAIEELSEPLTRFLRTCTDRIPEPVLPELHEASELLQRNAARTRSLSTLLDSTFDAAMAQLSIQQNEDMRKISAWVAIAAAPTMIAGIYGMNFTHFPELSWRFGYPSVLAVMAAIMLGLFRAFRRSGWL